MTHWQLIGILTSVLGVVGTGTWIGFHVGKNGSKAHGDIYKEVKKKVDIPECHRAMDSVKANMNTGFDSIGKRFDDHAKHMDSMFGTMTKLIEQNGKT